MMSNIETLGSGLAPVLNLSGVSDEISFAAAALCERVKIEVVNLTPSRGPVVVPVRFVTDCESLPIDFLEEVVASGVASKSEFRALRKICAILNSTF